MKTLLLLIVVLVAPVGLVLAQDVPAGGTIESVQVTGIAQEALSTELRDSLQGLVGQRYDPQTAAQSAARIEREVPDVLAAPRLLAGADSSHVRLVFVIAHAGGAGGETDANVNSQYVVESVEVSGLQRSEYSDALYDDMQKMVGQNLDNERLENIRARLLSELQRQYLVRQKVERGSQAGHVKITFVVEKAPWLLRATIGRIADGHIKLGDTEFGVPSQDRNTVATVEVEGIPRSTVSDGLYAEMQLMVGKRVDQLEINHLRGKLAQELRNEYKISTTIGPGRETGQARVVFEAEWIPWLPYRTPGEILAYHPKQGWSLMCCEGNLFSKYTTLTAGWNGNDLVERYKGFSFGIESTSLGSRRLGGRFEFDSWGVQWKPQTRLALEDRQDIPGLYRSRIGIAPSLAFAFNRNIFATAGANFTELRIEGPSAHWEAAHEGVASLHYDSKKIERGKTRFEHRTDYEVRKQFQAEAFRCRRVCFFW